MGRFFKAVLLGIVILLIPILASSVEEKSNEDIILELLNDSGGALLEADINASEKIYDKFMGKKEIEALAKEIQGELGLTGEEEKKDMYDFNMGVTNYSRRFINDNNFNQLTLWGKNPQGFFTTMAITSYKNERTNTGDTTLHINFIIKKKFTGINGIINEIEKNFEKFNKEVEINTCIKASFDGQLDDREKEDKISTMIEKVKGDVKEEYRDEDVISITAYTPYIDEYVLVGEEKVNLNIATRYNDLEKNTYIWIGTPVITISY